MKSGGGRPVRGYRLASGKRVPSVTTIVSRFKDSGALIRWAWQQGIDGIDYNKTSKDAANAGTFAHDLIEADILGVDPVFRSAEELEMSTDDYAVAMQRANTAFGAYRDWRRSVSFEIAATEVPLVSETYRYGGTIDAVARIQGKPAIVDWKSSGRVYSDYLVQVAAYRHLWEEVKGEMVEEVHLLRVGKEFGDFHHHGYPLAVVDKAWRAFELQRELYEIDEVLKKAAA